MSVEEREVVAARRVEISNPEPHEHIIRVKLADDSEEAAEDVVDAIEAHEAHYIMRRPDLALPLLLQVVECPMCGARRLRA